MKKLLFSALACVAFAFSGFASNEVVNENEVVFDLEISEQLEEVDPIVGVYTCTVNVEIPDGKGGSVTVTHEQKYYFVRQSVVFLNCINFKNSTYEAYRKVLTPSPRF